MSVFGVVSPVLVGLFLIVSLMAAVVHHLAGSRQKVTMTFLALVAVALWLGSEPWAEPFPGAIKFIVILATVFQVVMAGVAYWVRDPKRNM